MFGGFGIWEALLILALILLFFGGKNIPELAKGLGSAIRNFKGELDRPAPAEEEEPREIHRGEDPGTGDR